MPASWDIVEGTFCRQPLFNFSRQVCTIFLSASVSSWFSKMH